MWCHGCRACCLENTYAALSCVEKAASLFGLTDCWRHYTTFGDPNPLPSPQRGTPPSPCEGKGPLAEGIGRHEGDLLAWGAGMRFLSAWGAFGRGERLRYSVCQQTPSDAEWTCVLLPLPT